MREREGVMLAKPLSEKTLRNFPDEVFVQRKINGNHMISLSENSNIVLKSSTAFDRTSNLPHTVKALKSHNLPFDVDGEIYVYGFPQATINGMINRNSLHPDHEVLEYHIFDIPKLTIRQDERVQILEELSELKLPRCIKIVQTYKIKKEEINSYCNRFISEGYEGVIIRNPIAFYSFGKSNNILKLKPGCEDTYKILDVLQAIGEDGTLKNMVGSFLCKDSCGNLFKVGAGKLTHAQRREYWELRGLVIGKYVHFKYLELSAYGTPTQGIAIEIVSEKNE